MPRAPWVLGKQDREGRAAAAVPAAPSPPTMSPARSRGCCPTNLPDGPRRAHAHRRWTTAPTRSIASRVETQAHALLLLRAARTTPRRGLGAEQLVGVGIGCHTMVALEHARPPRAPARDAADGRGGRRSGSVSRRLPASGTSSRTSATGPSTIPARWRSARRSRRRQHHLPPALQRRGRDDRWPAAAGQDVGARDRYRARGRGRTARS